MRKNDEKTRANLAKGKKFSKDYQPKKNGRKKLLKNILSDIPPDAEKKIYAVMLSAISCRSVGEAQRKLQEAEEEMPEYGLIYQETIRAIRIDGLNTIITVLDRIYGKKSNVDITTGGEQLAPMALVEFVDEKATKSKRKATK